MEELVRILKFKMIKFFFFLVLKMFVYIDFLIFYFFCNVLDFNMLMFDVKKDWMWYVCRYIMYIGFLNDICIDV